MRAGGVFGRMAPPIFALTLPPPRVEEGLSSLEQRRTGSVLGRFRELITPSALPDGEGGSSCDRPQPGLPDPAEEVRGGAEVQVPGGTLRNLGAESGLCQMFHVRITWRSNKEQLGSRLSRKGSWGNQEGGTKTRVEEGGGGDRVYCVNVWPGCWADLDQLVQERRSQSSRTCLIQSR